ncbi:MAG TPA: alcohol dehydrogenase catalytic domain-containing protein [Streptosporangiaceae bacterium]|nr:alcohol dehydrogenase catalytic domain-containing protein [Streptosporangiaceae bacterium]
MRALVFTAPSEVQLLDVPEPAAGPDDCVVEVRSVGICGSELHGVRDPGFRVPPLIMGHEFAGVADSGDAVIVNPVVSCRNCDLCRRETRQLCRERAIVGIARSGAFAERAAVPRSALRAMPASMDWDTAAMAEPAASAVHAWAAGGGDGQGLVRAEKRVVGSFAYTDENFDQAIELLGEWDLSWASAFPLADGAEVSPA